ncbi:Gfo/Idh/MocA family oxidoreductase [Botrimarina sp.]|uniref:Gfo/Idh/MocA family protein n=1 Tax=Botrimarina sp. TaxID=2795802 RepID=UPI0032EF16D0
MIDTTRRTFLIGSGAMALSLAAASRARADAPSERVRLGLIGCGSRGRAYYDRAVAVCDPDSARLAAGAKAAGVGSSDAHTDLRRLLDDPDIDAVAIATPDHWHAPAAILACQAGKHVYVEKPVSHNFRETQLLMQAVDRAGVVAQHGTQSRSRPAIRDAIARLREGVIGEVLVAKAWNIQHRGSIGHASPTGPPEGVDYDTWVGPAEWLPYQENRFHSDWHWWWNFGTGDIGNDGAHEIDYARWGLGVDALPTRVNATGGKLYYDDDQQCPDTATCAFEYAGAEGKPAKQLLFEMRLWSTNYPMNCDSGAEFYGTEGQMFLSKRGKLRIVGPRNEPIEEKRFGREKGFAHLDNFLAAVRGEAELNAPLIEAHRSVGPIHLANAAIRSGQSFSFDPVNERVIDADAAAAYLSRSYREGGHWAIPESA